MTIRRVVLLSLAAALVVSACSAGGSTPTPTSPPPDNACAPDGGDLIPVPAGWPGSDSPPSQDMVPIPVSSETVVGENRFLFTLASLQSQPLAAADLATELRFFDLADDAANPAVTTTGTYIEVSPGRGLYHTTVTFGCSGDWGVEVLARTSSGGEQTARAIFPVRPGWLTPAIGAVVPSVETPTADSAAGIAAISTDDDPDADFYGTSEATALADHRPFVLVFATPAFCKSAVCGPSLDIVKSSAVGFKDRLTFIHVEPYILEMRDGSLQPVMSGTDYQTVPSVEAFRLPTEPYIFVVRADGTLVAKFEGVAGQDELRAAFEAAAGS